MDRKGLSLCATAPWSCTYAGQAPIVPSPALIAPLVLLFAPRPVLHCQPPPATPLVNFFLARPFPGLITAPVLRFARRPVTHCQPPQVPPLVSFFLAPPLPGLITTLALRFARRPVTHCQPPQVPPLVYFFLVKPFSRVSPVPAPRGPADDVHVFKADAGHQPALHGPR